MGRTRAIFDLTLAGGAIAGILAIAAPQMPWGETPFQSIAPAHAVNHEPLAFAHFLGIAQFVKNPTEYGFVCGLECGSVPGDITSASLEGDRMTIEYTYPAQDAMRTGKLIGTVNSDGIFTGTYSTQSKSGLRQGDITFTFTAEGTAEGNYDKETGTTRIFR